MIRLLLSWLSVMANRVGGCQHGFPINLHPVATVAYLAVATASATEGSFELTFGQRMLIATATSSPPDYQAHATHAVSLVTARTR